jgi:acetylornithine deacetylase/succinyl-diaminopimelate desuccinylase-like protein
LRTAGGSYAPDVSEQIRAAVASAMPQALDDLQMLVRIPSVSAEPVRHRELRRSAEAVAELLRGSGFADVEITSVEGGRPAVIARKPAPPGARTVLLYAHHDVQPTGKRDLWESDPFEPTRRGGRLYGRGSADDKAGIVAHLTAVRALGERLAVGVTVFVEGEEEIGSPTLARFLEEYRGKLAADVIVIADSGNWDIGTPALTTSLRGIVAVHVELRTLEHGVHSGTWGGVVPDALTALCRLVATLHDENGEVAIKGLHSSKAADVDYAEDRVRAESSAVDGLEFIGTGSIVDRVWTKPAIAVLAVDAPSVAEASNTLVPAARAKISMRIPPGETTEHAAKLLAEHLESHAPWGSQVTVTLVEAGEPFAIDVRGPAYDAARAAFTAAWDGTAPVDMGVGGSIPFIAAFADAFPKAAILVTGVEDPDTRAHGSNEGLHLAEFERVCVAEALLLSKLAPDS